MYGLIVGVILLCALLLILVVLMQNPKGGGLSSQFGGSGASQVMGVKKTGDVLEKATWALAIAIVLLTLGTNFAIPTETDFVESPNIENAQQQGIMPSTPNPNAVQPADNSSLEDLNLQADDSASN